MEDESIYVRRERKKRNQINLAREASFENYIRKLLHNLDGHGGASISEKALEIIDDVLKNFITDLSSEAKQLMMASKKRTLTAWDIQKAVGVVLKGEVAKHAISEGVKAVTMYSDITRQT
ncbi:hypothetical protein AVEN_117832-1 [Araneus ventricosus]|uniref:Core Histone H2A/H2B/H3 domain-containing protein n=1 Tax=Araneus ventricosus TaxID=182803 RepID=A0A4Y2B8A7_ARAVE|nr:hypothetical protein AVEN_117832-1 [Araneus ventricosus]